ncbi:hypothetical protein Nepgr_015265 [Nepenthes gracilis]|uniref:K Homology domain-containing protein n=1 Tax=Nepenthes gracilis TaxID=150966 RepID=A0AAD3XQY6_NEPGR|nr:hypothetical protein Nepgr_015265 [Nepenthes gracilis]
MERAGQEPGTNEGHKRKIEDEIELAKQRAQEIAARLLNTADSKRPRLDSAPAASELPYSNSTATYQSQFPVSYAPQSGQYNGLQGTSKKIHIPNAKVGVIIGRAGDMIKNLQLRSGARIQITRDAEADPTSLTRDVELMGTADQISRAEQLISEVIAETDAASSASSGNRSTSAVQPGAEQFVMKVPNDKVALIIGKGGETIKSMQSKSGARIQVVPLHLPPGDTSTERSVYINGTTEQIESAKELINEVISGNRLKSLSGSTGYTQPAYPTSGSWPLQGQPPVPQQPAYGYAQQGTYSTIPPPYYGSYPPQQAGWEQTNPSAVSQSSEQNTTSYMYGQQAQPTSTPTNVSYNYSQMPPATGYNYNQGYTQQPPSYGQDFSGQPSSVEPQKPYANPAYGASATSSQPDGTTPTQTSQPGYYGPPAVSSQADGTSESQPSPAYATGYNQTTAAANGYGTYSGYAAQPPALVGYNQTGYAQTGYGHQQQGMQAPPQASQAYYGQSGYPLPQVPEQANYYQGTYPSVAGQPQIQQPHSQSLSTNGVSPPSSYGIEKVDDGNPANGSGGAAQETDNPRS